MKWCTIKERIAWRLLQVILPDILSPKGDTISPHRVRVAYKEAYRIEDFSDILKRQIRRMSNDVALRAPNMEQVTFYRGAMFSLQLILKHMKTHHDAWVKENEKEKRSNA